MVYWLQTRTKSNQSCIDFLSILSRRERDYSCLTGHKHGHSKYLTYENDIYSHLYGIFAIFAVQNIIVRKELCWCVNY